MRSRILDVYIIETPLSQRSAPLIKLLSSEPRINLFRISAKMVASDRDISDFGIKVNYKVFPILEGRLLSHGEIGCAQSHNEARSLLAESTNGGVILEDDARILDLDSFINVSSSFLNQNRNSKRILSLTGISQINAVNKKKDKGPANQWMRTYGHTPLAVANAITPMAASDLFKSNQPIKYVADWPYSKSKFYSVKVPVVCHGDETTASLIEASGSRQSITNRNLLFYVYSFLSYFTTRNKQLGVRPYFNWIVVQRFSHRFNIFLSAIRKIST
jgi:GR25 family glycosyltransferase involved in LPS biosynthesis